jgi:hypothetical protein
VHWLLGIALCTMGCGRILFEELPGARSDSGAGSAVADGGTSEPPALVSSAFGASGRNITSLSFMLDVPAGSNYALIAFHIGSQCFDPSVSTVTSVSLAATMLSRVHQRVGTPCGPASTRSELWALAAPPLGTSSVAIQLAQPEDTIHGVGVALSGVDVTDPIGAVASDTGFGVTASVAVASATGQLVLSFVGQGDGINGSTQPQIYLDNVSAVNTMDNSAASQAPGVSPSVTMGWSFRNPDEWQVIVASVR